MEYTIEFTLQDNAIMPVRSQDGDIGYDITCVSVTEHDKFTEYDTGVSVSVPNGLACLILPRSSITNKPAVMGNSIGLLDQKYRQTLKVRMYHFSEERYKVGDRIAQLIFYPVPETTLKYVEKLDETERKGSGFGGSGS